MQILTLILYSYFLVAFLIFLVSLTKSIWERSDTPEEQPDPWTYYPLMLFMGVMLASFWPIYLVYWYDQYKMKKLYQVRGLSSILNIENPGYVRKETLKLLIKDLPNNEKMTIIREAVDSYLKKEAAKSVDDPALLETIIADQDTIFWSIREKALMNYLDLDFDQEFLCNQVLQGNKELEWDLFVNITDPELVKKLQTWVNSQEDLYEGYQSYIDNILG